MTNQAFMRYLMELDTINFEHPILFVKEIIFQFFEWQNVNMISQKLDTLFSY
jgi:hypothetical protein